MKDIQLHLETEGLSVFVARSRVRISWPLSLQVSPLFYLIRPVFFVFFTVNWPNAAFFRHLPRLGSSLCERLTCLSVSV